jgi:hypothetical protein
VALWLAVDGRPMNTVSTPAFADVCACAGFQPPSRGYITGLVTGDLAQEADMFMMESLTGAATLSIVTDGWTSPDGKSHFEGIHVLGAFVVDFITTDILSVQLERTASDHNAEAYAVSIKNILDPPNSKLRLVEKVVRLGSRVFVPQERLTKPCAPGVTHNGHHQPHASYGQEADGPRLTRLHPQPQAPRHVLVARVQPHGAGSWRSLCSVAM